MRRKIYFLLMLFVILLFNMDANADTCSSSELARLYNLASHVEFTYDYEWKVYKEKNDKYTYPSFYIVANNLNEELKVLIENDYLNGDYIEFKNNGNGMGIIDNLSGGANIVISIRGYSKNDCSGKLIMTKRIKLPILNLFSYEDACIEYTDFKYCNNFLDEKITYDKFASELNNYLKIKNEASISASTIKLDNSSKNTNPVIKIVFAIVILMVIVGISIYIIVKKQKERL